MSLTGLALRRALRFVVPLLIVTTAGGLALGCKERSACREACTRVAACKKLATDGEPILGEGKPPLDPACLDKCEKQREEFDKCEGKKRTCSELRTCRGEFR